MMAQTHAHTQAPWQYSAAPSMDDAQFSQWVALLESRIGISLPVSRRTFLITNLHMRMRELGVDNYHAYYEMVTDASRGQVEWETLVDKLTVHETRFFRDSHALDLIRDEYLQKLIDSDISLPYTVHTWSVGCATGEEAYTLAMILDRFLQDAQEMYYGVTASDISRAALQTGREALYHKRRISNVPAQMAADYLLPVDEDHVQVMPQLRRHVCFNYLNLLNLDSQPAGEMDIILCQNVLIYFNHQLRERILGQLVTRLKPGGLLVLGAGEIFSWSHPLLEAVKHESTQAYRRMDAKGGN